MKEAHARSRIGIVLQGTFWIIVYVLLSTAPLFVLLIGPTPPGREFWRELSVALGFAGLAMVALQFVLTARFKVVKAPYGSDIVYYFHRQISLVAFALVLAHPLLLFVFDPRTLRLLNLVAAPWRARAGVVALASLVSLIVISVWRKRLKIDYTPWRVWHGLLATAAVSLALAHIVLVGHHVNTPAKRILWVGYGVFWVGLLAYVRVIKPALLLRRPYVVEQVIQQRGNAWTLALVPVGHRGLTFKPGQFAWLTAWHSPFSDTEHPFSFSSSALDRRRLEFTIKAVGDFTRTVQEMEPGQRVYVDGPFGAFSVDRHPHAERYVFVAGGIGITPIMSMLRTLADRGDHRPLTLLYANRTWAGVTFREELAELEQRLNLKVVYVLSAPHENWPGERGRINQALLERYLPRPDRRDSQEVFICGPKPMMDAVEKALVALHVPVGDFHSERFDLV
jgi:predicted ferric reductase